MAAHLKQTAPVEQGHNCNCQLAASSHRHFRQPNGVTELQQAESTWQALSTEGCLSGRYFVKGTGLGEISRVSFFVRSKF